MTLVDERAAAPAASVTPARILDAPLNQLFAETGVEVIDSTITDREFFGAVVQRRGGKLLLTMPTGRSELEHDTVARYLLAQVFEVDLPQLPPPFITTKI